MWRRSDFQGLSERCVYLFLIRFKLISYDIPAQTYPWYVVMWLELGSHNQFMPPFASALSTCRTLVPSVRTGEHSEKISVENSPESQPTRSRFWTTSSSSLFWNNSFHIVKTPSSLSCLRRFWTSLMNQASLVKSMSSHTPTHIHFHNPTWLYSCKVVYFTVNTLL